jgi:hypothetical protein
LPKKTKEIGCLKCVIKKGRPSDGGEIERERERERYCEMDHGFAKESKAVGEWKSTTRGEFEIDVVRR